ncbi:hypothetical protein AX14_011577 [Amanita brunnescens Koide BX004]|nr:hypothetical protein AX14_011577 [Amanita brunnescens Koide BX004]
MARTFVFIDQSFAHSSQTVTHSLYNLAAYQDYVQPLREEIESVLQEHGWSKASVAKMTKLDSFVNETMRLSPIAACTPGRFFVVNVIKAILAHILLDYDIKMANGGGCPESIWFGWASLPNTKPEVLFKKRA